MLGVALTHRHKHKHTQAPPALTYGDLKCQTLERSSAARLMPPSCGWRRNCTRDGIGQIWYGLFVLGSVRPSVLSPFSLYLPSFLPPLLHCDKYWDTQMHLRQLLLSSSRVKEKRKSGKEITELNSAVCQPPFLGSWDSPRILTKARCSTGCYWQRVVKWI